MTATDVAAPPPPPFVPPVPPRTPVAVLAVVSFVLAVLTAILYMTAKTLVPVFDGQAFEKQVDTIATVFGILGFLSIVLIAAAVLLGHLGVRKSTRGRRGRVLGFVGLGIGYLLLALYFNRLIVAGLALATFPHGGNFLQDNFYWA